MLMVSGNSVSLIFDIVAVLIILGMWMIHKKSGGKDDPETRLFMGMGICVIIGAVFDIIGLSGIVDKYRFLIVMFSTLAYISEVAFMFFLLLYTDYAFFGSKDHLRRHFAAYVAPFAIIAAVDIVNVFVGILYTTGDDGVATLTWLYYVISIVESLYLLIPAVYLVICYAKTGKKRFFHPLSICVPILCGVIISYITSYSVHFLGFSIGLAFLDLSKLDSKRFIDARTGLYNRAYLDYILKMIADKKGAFKGMITSDIEGDEKAFSGVLKEELPSAGELVNMGNGRFVYFADTGDMTELDMAASLVSMGAEEYDEDHDDKILLQGTECRNFKDDEAIQAAIETLTKRSGMDHAGEKHYEFDPDH